MALETIITDVYLDVYDHDTSPSTIKAISSDKQSRYVRGFLQREGLAYSIDQTAQVFLVALRPDRTTVVGPASVVELEPADGDSPAINGVLAEIRKEMTEVSGTVRMQFKIVQNNVELRTEIFNVLCGTNLENAGNCVVTVEE